MKAKNKFIMFQNCIPVKGSKNAIICDLQKRSYINITLDLYNFIVLHNYSDVNSIKKISGEEVANSYLSFLTQNNYAFYSSSPENFPPMDLSFHYGALISNAIVTVSDNINVSNIIDQLELLQCKFVEFHILKDCFNQICSITRYIDENEMILTSIGFIVNYQKGMGPKKLLKLLKKFPRISYIIIVNYKSNTFIPPIRENNTGYLIFTNKVYQGEKSCGNVSKEYFVSNIKFFTESKAHNSCLNKKISIDKDGNIKNCPSMQQHYGSVKNTLIKNVLNHPDFKKYWNLNKDDIEVCKDCEFRYICTDCRAYTERSHINESGLDISKPLKCGYNPYIGEWEKWSSNPLKQNAIKYYDMQTNDIKQ
ncbi:grasp-with-spasm system SPASM domain peptide maturase [Elizabethkingia meningoseptica]|uniref:grasp-with-spasm system SPASM domain peptide maturase n=1 Tax=Elizabethkingia meningoseptica TaxID=238 RepID=UPI0023AEFFBA|nr:grasp-with-spasm system SPASM domain peptide maturase [Elizabethkingia meningoseptica]MDE5437495.1 grasp-with-spasm system SPASM domain peptide maturase [Elizabethkingia meningoseptica]MDE5507407.1 grasp-with-spasm system SPASM domain peptide maturase [Elizabethkingia meningoseptica]MDE5515310.1 grasp-with-spasm system SPASM domain peptide maturase [Elizabethkingia meningoseptica]MDE5526302.1 grasp-with-spasm system SPASM domain peptide maturase [Elizabethkingia meningoseptica]MDE5529577.1 